jgi:rhomboid protease GluP
VSGLEENVFWKTAHFLIVRNGYRIIQLSKDQQELWLEKMENKEAQVIRLLRYDLDWSNWLQRDIESVAARGERIGSRYARGKMTIMNLYVTSYPPVDDYQHRIDAPYVSAKGKVQITSVVAFRNDEFQSLKILEQVTGTAFSLVYGDDELERETVALSTEALAYAEDRAREEQAFFQSGKPFFTYVFLVVQVLVFLLMELRGGSTDTSTLIRFGAKFNPLIVEGEWWRFFTPMVLHIGMLHLFMNSIALFYLGPMIERIFGNIRFVFIYIFAGFAGSLASFLFSPNLSAGASGAIFGCFGALLYFGMSFPGLFFRTMGLNIIAVLVINLIFGFTMPGIDNAGHIGGLVGGFAAAGMVHFPKKRKRILKQTGFLAGTALLTLMMLQYGFTHSSAIIDEQSVLILAQDYLQNDEYEEARSLLLDYHSEEEASADILFLLSFAEIKLENFEDAKYYLHQVLELKPDFHEAHYNLALVYLQQKEFEDARIHAEEAVQLQPENEDYQNLFNRVSAFLESAG